MSKLDELIQKYCPNGVEYKPLHDVSIMQRGQSLTKANSKNGLIPVISGGKTPAFFCNDYNRQGETITVAGSGAGAGYVQYFNIPIFANDCFTIKGDKSTITRYLFYCLKNKQDYIYGTKKGGGVPHVHISDIQNMDIPVPPLPVQEEIVRILDNFTELTAELQAELQARKKQYEYYRNELINNSLFSNVELRSVVKKSSSGGTPKKNVSEFYNNGVIPWIRTQDVTFNEITEVSSFITEEAVKKTSAKWIPENCVIVAISGASAGRCAINKIKATTNQHCLNLEIDESKALYKYVYYCICSRYDELIERKQGARGDLNSSLILGINIPVPSLAEQKHIVNILDYFNTLCNDLTTGLPAEIESRQKQYEYYRDKLLAFKPLS